MASGKSRATALTPIGEVRGTVVGVPVDEPPVLGEVADAVYEPDPAVFAAGLDGLLAEQSGLARISSASGYLTGPQGCDSALLSGFRVEEVLPLREKLLADHLASHSVGVLELKCRGVDIDLAKLRRSLRLRGDRSATVLLTQIEKRAIVIVARRIGAQG